MTTRVSRAFAYALLSSYNALAKRLPHGPLMGVKRYDWLRVILSLFFCLVSAKLLIGTG